MNVLGNTSYALRQVPGILVTIIVFCQSVAAQEPLHLRGLVNPCYGVTVPNGELPVDTLILDRQLPDTVTTAYLICMKVAAAPDTTGTGDPSLPSCVGTRTAITILSTNDSLIVIALERGRVLPPTCTYQLVVPFRADTITVDSTLTTRPWNGSSGGALIIEASRELVLNDTISVKGLGFRGGARSVNGGECNSGEICASNSSARSGGKGESFHQTDVSCAAGYPAWGTGGGGGGAHNCGGGGGGNGGSGGRGGDQFTGCGNPGFFGLPGRTSARLSDAHTLFGGGGGGGHQNNNVASDGASGGGLIILRAPLLYGARAVCVASGNAVMGRAGNDGAGGGGAGGTIVIDVCKLASPMTLVASGGAGGNCDDSHGPGGGGGGGRVLLHPSIYQQSMGSCTIDVSGGKTGMVHSLQTSMNAQAGADGIVDVLCNAVPVHEIAVDTVVTIGNTTAITLKAAEAQQNCDVFVEHTVAFEGGSVVPILDGSDAFIVTQDTSYAWNRRSITLQVPSTQDAKLVLQGVVSRDTVSVITIQSSLAGLASLCDVRTSVQHITADACASKLRPIVLGLPFRVRLLGSDASGIRYRLEAHRSAEVQLRLFNIQGQLAAESVITELPNIEPGVHVYEGTLDLQHVSHGLYYLTAISSLGVSGINVLWRP